MWLDVKLDCKRPCRLAEGVRIALGLIGLGNVLISSQRLANPVKFPGSNGDHVGEGCQACLSIVLEHVLQSYSMEYTRMEAMEEELVHTMFTSILFLCQFNNTSVAKERHSPPQPLLGKSQLIH